MNLPIETSDWNFRLKLLIETSDNKLSDNFLCETRREVLDIFNFGLLQLHICKLISCPEVLEYIYLKFDLDGSYSIWSGHSVLLNVLLQDILSHYVYCHRLPFFFQLRVRAWCVLPGAVRQGLFQTSGLHVPGGPSDWIPEPVWCQSSHSLQTLQLHRVWWGLRCCCCVLGKDLWR